MSSFTVDIQRSNVSLNISLNVSFLLRKKNKKIKPEYIVLGGVAVTVIYPCVNKTIKVKLMFEHNLISGEIKVVVARKQEKYGICLEKLIFGEIKVVVAYEI